MGPFQTSKRNSIYGICDMNNPFDHNSTLKFDKKGFELVHIHERFLPVHSK